MCESQFTCASQVSFAGYDLVGVHWFLFMVVLAFALQTSANFIWLRSSQLTREILQRKPHTTDRNNRVRWRIFWELMGTLNWILRITLIIGSNLYIFVVILIGNITGIAWALEQQNEDNTGHVCIGDPAEWNDQMVLNMYTRLEEIQNKKNKKLVL